MTALGATATSFTFNMRYRVLLPTACNAHRAPAQTCLEQGATLQIHKLHHGAQAFIFLRANAPPFLLISTYQNLVGEPIHISGYTVHVLRKIKHCRAGFAIQKP